MKPAAVRLLRWIALPASALVLGGCVGVATAGYGYTPVYGDYGYVGPWNGPPVAVDGGYFASPPYSRYHAGDHRREAPAPQRGREPEHRAPARAAAPRPIPSIPNAPRPEPRQGGNGRNRR